MTRICLKWILPFVCSGSQHLVRWLIYDKSLSPKFVAQPNIIQRTSHVSSNVRFMRSTTPFCCGISQTVKYRIIPSFWHNFVSVRFVLAALSVLSCFIFLPIWVSIIFQLRNTSTISCLWRIGTLNSSQVIIHERYKPIWISQWSSFVRSPSGYMHIVHNCLIWRIAVFTWLEFSNRCS